MNHALAKVPSRAVSLRASASASAWRPAADSPVARLQRISGESGAICAAFSKTSTAARQCPIACSTRPRLDHASALRSSIATAARSRSSASASLPVW